jgi:tryptophan halogenase
MVISDIVVLGGGSAGLIAAITLKRVLPHLGVTLVRSPEIGIIGVGEGTTPFIPVHFHRFLRLPCKEFYEMAQPTWKLGIRFLWGPREEFFYTFDQQFSTRFADLPRNNGFYCMEDCRGMSLSAALVECDKAFCTDDRGRPVIPLDANAYHIENIKLVSWLEWQAAELGVVIREDTVVTVDHEGDQVRKLHLKSGGALTADLFVDASGFASRLLGQALEEPFLDYSDTLFCDRAVIAPRPRESGETIQPYTTAETMDHGWCWRIDHEHHVNRGYVYSSAFVSDGDAEAEFRTKNPGAGESRIVKFRSGRYERSWVGNVVAVGNAAGFVEPLEATALMILCAECRSIAEGLLDSMGEPGPLLKEVYNRFMGIRWDEIRDFLAVHYRFNTRLDTAFWRHCRAETPLHGAQKIVDFYRENGPSLLAKSIFISENDQFGIEGYLAMLVGMKVPHAKMHEPEPEELHRVQAKRAAFAARAAAGIGVADALRTLRDPRWVWQS